MAADLFAAMDDPALSGVAVRAPLWRGTKASDAPCSRPSAPPTGLSLRSRIFFLFAKNSPEGQGPPTVNRRQPPPQKAP